MRLEQIFRTLVDDEVPVSFRAYDGSAIAATDAIATVEVRTPEAVRYMLSCPGQLGLTRAYVTGTVEVHGDLHAALHALHAHRRRDVGPRELVRRLRGLPMRLLRRPRLPAEEAPLRVAARALPPHEVARRLRGLPPLRPF